MQKVKLLQKIIEAISDNSDLNQILNIICKEINSLFNVDRTTIRQFRQRGNYLQLLYVAEYTTSKTMLTGEDFVVSEEVNEYLSKTLLDEGKDIIFDDIDALNVPNFYREYHHKLGTKSVLNVPIRKGDDKWGVIAIYQDSYSRHWTNEEIELLHSIVDYIYVAIRVEILYSTVKKQAERESILRDINNKVRSSLDLEYIKQEMVNQIGKLLKADRVAIAYYDYEAKNYIVSNKGEYRSSDKVKTFVGQDFTSIPGFVEYIRNFHFKGKDIIFNDLEQYLDKNNLIGTGVEFFYRDFGFSSSAAINMYYGDVFLGDLVVTFGHKRVIMDYEIEFLKTLADQAGVAFHQAELYKAERERAKKEKILRTTIEILRSTLDPEKIKKDFIELTGSYFDADRCLFDDYEKETEKFLPFRLVWLKSPDVKSLKGVSVEDEFPEFAAKLKKGRNIIIKDLEKTLSRKRFTGYKAVETLFKGGVKSDYGFLVKYQDQIMGILILHFINKKKVFKTDELDFLKVLRDQVGIALYQAELYAKQKEIAKKELILREVISTINFSKNTEEVYNYVLSKLANLFNVNRTFFVEVPETEFEKLFIKYEFNKKTDQSSFKNQALPETCVNTLFTTMKNLNIFTINDVKVYHPENKELQEFFGHSNVKSICALPLIKNDKEKIVFGVIVLCSQEKRTWTNDEIKLMEEILNASKTVIWEIMKRNEIDELRNTFIATLAHDLEVPLIGEQRALEFIISIPPGQLLDKYKDIIIETIKENKNILRFLKKLVDSYNYELGRKELYLSNTNISDLINEVVDCQRNFAKTKSISLEVDLQDNLPFIEIDRDEVTKVLTSLIRNAITYSYEGKSVKISGTLTNKNIMICIKDEGTGISEEIQKHLFKRYEMALTIERKIGAGLGSYLSKQIIKAHNGDIFVETKVNIGTTFCFSLPVN